MRRGSNTTRSNVSSSFQSTHSITECDFRLNVKNAEATISIHALHYRVRQRLLWYQNDGGIFQSTHSITECDGSRVPAEMTLKQFQSTHSITECDIYVQNLIDVKSYFNPRTPLQSATRSRIGSLPRPLFQSTHSITECDLTPLR